MGPGSSRSRKQGKSQLYLKAKALGTATSWWHVRGPHGLGLPTLAEVPKAPGPISSQLPRTDPQGGFGGLAHTRPHCPLLPWSCAWGFERQRAEQAASGPDRKGVLTYSLSHLTQKGLLSNCACSSTAMSPKGPSNRASHPLLFTQACKGCACPSQGREASQVSEGPLTRTLYHQISMNQLMGFLKTYIYR